MAKMAALASLAFVICCVALVVWWESGIDILAQPASVAIERIQAKQRSVYGTGLGGLDLATVGSSDGHLLIRVAPGHDAKGVICRVAVRSVFTGCSFARTDCSQADAGDRPLRELGADALTIVVREHVVAAAENKDYDIDGVANRMIAFVVTHRLAIIAAMPRPSE